MTDDGINVPRDVIDAKADDLASCFAGAFIYITHFIQHYTSSLTVKLVGRLAKVAADHTRADKRPL